MKHLSFPGDFWKGLVVKNMNQINESHKSDMPRVSVAKIIILFIFCFLCINDDLRGRKI